MSVADDVANHLRALLEADGYAGIAVRTGGPRPVSPNPSLPGATPATCIFVMGTGGFTSIPFIDGGGRGAEERPTVQVFVRVGQGDVDNGEDLADDVFAALDMRPPTGFFEARAQGSAPMDLGPDDAGQNVWSINVWLKRQRPSS